MPPEKTTPPNSKREPGKAVLIHQEQYSGLFPHPRLMREWDQVVPGSAVRIFDRFEKQSDHRMNIETKVIRANNFKQYTGPIFAFLIAMTAIIGGIYTALQNHPYLGGTLTFAGLAAVIAPFLISVYKSTPEKKEG